MSNRKYTITLTEHQLRLIAQCVEDCHRFAAGQTELDNTIAFLDNRRALRDKLRSCIQPLVTPELPYNASYDWSGGHCPNEHQRKYIAETYAIYREIYHRLAVLNRSPGDPWNCYLSDTLTCDEGGTLPTIKRL